MATDDTPGNLGVERAAYSWRAARSGVEGDALRVWHDDGRVVALELDRPRIDWGALKSVLGEPTAKLAFYKDVNKVDQGQWVYADRGLAFLTWLGDEQLVRVVVFPPMSVEDYEAKLAFSVLPPRER